MKQHFNFYRESISLLSLRIAVHAQCQLLPSTSLLGVSADENQKLKTRNHKLNYDRHKNNYEQREVESP